MHCGLIIVATFCCLAIGLTQVSQVRAVAPSPVLTPLAPVNPATPPPNFARELKSVLRALPKKQIRYLVQAYLLNDAGFQSLVRAINTIPAFRVRQQFLNQPEFRQLSIWTAQQLVLSGGSAEIFDDLEISIFNKFPHWALTVNGVRGFQQELTTIYPLETMRTLLIASAQQSPVFAEFWRRIVAVKPAYERIIATPQAKAVIAELRRLGVNVDTWDSAIRYQLGWSNSTSISDYDYGVYLGDY